MEKRTAGTSFSSRTAGRPKAKQGRQPSFHELLGQFVFVTIARRDETRPRLIVARHSIVGGQGTKMLTSLFAGIPAYAPPKRAKFTFQMRLSYPECPSLHICCQRGEPAPSQALETADRAVDSVA